MTALAAPRVLVVDDDPLVTRLLEAILGRAGFAVQVADNGWTALELLTADPEVVAVVLDRQMPGMDGLEVLAHMKRLASLRNIPVVLATALGSAEEVHAGLQAGAIYYLVKPLVPSVVVQVVAAATTEYATKRKLWAEMEGVRSAMGLIRHGVYRFQTLRQCEDLATLLAKACPDPRRTVIGLLELMTNALEHGNLGITYEEKGALLASGAWAFEVERREALAQYRDLWVEVTLDRTGPATRFQIQDMGPGFLWQAYMEVDPERMFDSHGRGILLARWEAFDRLEYLGDGNCVVAEVDPA